MSNLSELAAQRHRRIVNPESTVGASSLGDEGAIGLARRARGHALDALVARASTSVVAAPVADPPIWSLSAHSEDANALAAAAAAGNRQAIERLLESIRPIVVRYCRARFGHERSFASADDVAQEVCLAVLTSLPTYRDQGRPFLAFVYGIAAHKVADAHRVVGRNRSETVAEVPDVQDAGDGPEQLAVRQDISVRMGELLRVLPEKQREILVLRVVVGLSAEETAAIVDSTPGAVRVAQHRALAQLRKAISAPEKVI